MEEVIDACETLADTGNSQLLVIIGGLLLVALATAWLLTGRKQHIKFMVAALGILFGFSLLLAPVTSYAQSNEDECVEVSADTDANEDEDDEAAVLGLVDDSGQMQIPDGDSLFSSTIYLGILNNDTTPVGDPLDWETVDLDPDTAGVQTSIAVPHPDDSAYSCARITVSTFGILEIQLDFDCYDDAFENSLEIPGGFTIPAFTYTAETESGAPAPTPATVTVEVLGSAPSQVVFADEQGTCATLGTTTIDLTYGATTSVGIIDPASVDLNPSLPGQQTSITLPSGVTVTVDALGEASTDQAADPGDEFFYTISNNNGTVSNINRVGLESGCE